MKSSPRAFSSPASFQRAAATCSVTTTRIASGQLALHDGAVHPRRCARRASRTRSRSTRGEPAVHDLDDGALDLGRRDALERAFDAARGAPGGRARACSSSAATAQHADRAGRDPDRAPGHGRAARTAPRCGACSAIALLPERQHHASLGRSPREAGLEHPPDELVEFDAALPRGLRHQRVARHAGRRVHLEQPRPAGAVAHEIHAAPAAAVDREERGEREAAELLLRGAASRPGQMYCVSSATYLAW